MTKAWLNNLLQVDDREHKLPLWVQEKITSLRHVAESLQTELHLLKTGSEPGPFYLENMDNGRFYLPKYHGGQLFYMNSKGERINIHERYDMLEIMGMNAIRVLPQSSNVVFIDQDK